MYGKKANSIFRRRNMLIMLCLIFFGISATIILALVLGQKTGDFVIRVQDGNTDKSIMITTVEPADPVDKNTLVPMLAPNGVTGFTDYSPKYFMPKNFDTIREYTEDTNPKKVDGLYTHMGPDGQSVSLYCYTFYVVNTGGSAVSVDVRMEYQASQLDDIIRVMSYTNDVNGNERAIIYQKPDTIPYDYVEYPMIKGLSLKQFPSKNVIFNDEKLFVDIDSYTKYSVFFWIEGFDPDSQENAERFYGQTIKFELKLSVNMGG